MLFIKVVPVTVVCGVPGRVLLEEGFLAPEPGTKDGACGFRSLALELASGLGLLLELACGLVLLV